MDRSSSPHIVPGFHCTQEPGTHRGLWTLSILLFLCLCLRGLGGSTPDRGRNRGHWRREGQFNFIPFGNEQLTCHSLHRTLQGNQAGNLRFRYRDTEPGLDDGLDGP